MTAIANLPDLRPSLLLDFANSGRVDPRIQCTRASSATCFGSDGKLRTVAVNTPRIDYDPVTGKCLGLLVEATRTNLVTRSMALTGWFTGPNATISEGAVAIDGLTPSCRITAAALSYSSVAEPLSVTAGTYTQSIYYRGTSKPLDGTLLRCEEIQSDGSKTVKVLSFADASVIADGEWRRYSLTVTHLAAGTVSVYYAVDATPLVAVDICAAQYEAGAFPTSYIPTEASAVTRAADVPVLQEQLMPAFGTLLVEYRNAGWKYTNTKPVGNLDLSKRVDTGGQINDHVERAMLYPRQLTATQIQRLTA